MRIAAICIAQPVVLDGKSYKTGIFKRPVGTGVMVDAQGLVGDAVCNRKHHGGPDQAVYGLGSIDLDWWAQDLSRAIEPGLFGENLVIEGLDSRDVAVGDRFETAQIVLEVTSTRIPCATLSARMGDPSFARRFKAGGRPGFYCRVLQPGTIAAGDEVAWHKFSGERVTMPEMLAKSLKSLSPEDRRRYLASPLGIRVRAQLGAADPVHHTP